MDLIPEGVPLLNELANALYYSHEADAGYLQWAEQVRDQGCGSGNADVGDTNSSLARPHKEAFAQRWNRAIYPNFNVQRIEPGKL